MAAAQQQAVAQQFSQVGRVEAAQRVAATASSPVSVTEWMDDGFYARTKGLHQRALDELEALRASGGTTSGTVVVTMGDTPLLQGDTLVELVADHEASGRGVTLLTGELPEPTVDGVGFAGVRRQEVMVELRVEELDDPRVGLVQEPLVAGAHPKIDPTHPTAHQSQVAKDDPTTLVLLDLVLGNE